VDDPLVGVDVHVCSAKLGTAEDLASDLVGQRGVVELGAVAP
jgi:hypothetical protein